MAIVTGSLIAAKAPKIFDSVGGLFSGRSSKRESRDEIKSQLLQIGVRRSAWRNFNSDSVKAGRDLLKFLMSDPYAVDLFNRQFVGKNINRSNVDSFMNNAANKSGGTSSNKSTVLDSDLAEMKIAGFGLVPILLAVSAVGGWFFYNK